MNRFKLEELSLKRVLKGVLRRIQNLPHVLLWNITKKANQNRKKLKSFKDIHKGERCFLIANGPSLKITNILINISRGKYKIQLKKRWKFGAW